MFFVVTRGCQNLSVNTNYTLVRTTCNLQGIGADMSSWRLSFAGQPKGANGGSENSLWLPLDTAKAVDCVRGPYFADARERFTGPTRTFFSFSTGKRRVLLLARREGGRQ